MKVLFSIINLFNFNIYNKQSLRKDQHDQQRAIKRTNEQWQLVH